MTRTVFSGDMVFHVWANQSAPEGRRSDDRVFFHGRTIYSFGSHFALGYVAPGATLLNADSYSMTTSRHKSQTARAVSGRRFTVPGLTTLAGTLDRLADTAERVARYRQAGWNKAGHAQAREWQMAQEHLARFRAQVVAYVESNVLALSDDAAAFLLELAVSRRTVAPIRAKAEAKRDALALAEKRADAAKLRRQVAQAGKASRADIVANAIAEARGWGGETRFAAFLTELRRLHRAASRLKLPRYKAAIHAHIRALAASQDETLGRAAAKERNQYRKENVRIVRATLPAFLAGTANANALANLARAADGLARRVLPHGLDRRLRALDDAAGWACNAVQARERAERERKRNMEAAEARADWLAGGRGHYRLSADDGSALVRVVGDVLETSHGADVPLAHALKAYRFAKLCRATGTPFQRNGRTIRVGHFQVDSIDVQGNMVAGCHRIGFDAMRDAAQRAGLDLDATPSDDAIETREHA